MIDNFCRWVDNINEWIGKIISWLFLPLTFLVVIDVFTRYVLNNPWYFLTINVQIMGVLAVLGAGYCYLHKGHVSVDVLITHLSERARAKIEAIPLLFMLGVFSILLWKSSLSAITAIEVGKRELSGLGFPMSPYKIIVVIGLILLILQGISLLIRDLRLIFPTKPRGKA